VEVKNVSEGVYKKIANKIPRMHPKLAAQFYVSSRMYDTSKAMDDALSNRFFELKPQVDSLIKDLNANPTSANMYDTCLKFNKLFDDEADKAKKSKDHRKGDTTSRSSEDNIPEGTPGETPKETPDEETSKPKYARGSSDVSTPNRVVSDDHRKLESTIAEISRHIVEESSATEESNPAGIGTLVFDQNNMRQADRYKGIRLRPRRKPSAFGATFRYTHRILTDKACFATPMKDNLGTVLVDASGSMGISNEQLKELLKFSGRATIAAYSGRGERGDIVVLAKGGRCVSKVLNKYGCNVVDADAVDWLITQPSPRWWICDGGVTGFNDCYSIETSLRCLAAMKKGRVTKVGSLYEFMDAVKNNALKKIKNDFSMCGLNKKGEPR
jgi:hypothetical protein